MSHDEHPRLSSHKVNEAHCLQLRHKGMYIPASSDRHDLNFLDPYDSTHYWCVYTQRGLGPDGEPVNPQNCRDGRGCCEH